MKGCFDRECRWLFVVNEKLKETWIIELLHFHCGNKDIYLCLFAVLLVMMLNTNR